MDLTAQGKISQKGISQNNQVLGKTMYPSKFVYLTNEIKQPQAGLDHQSIQSNATRASATEMRLAGSRTSTEGGCWRFLWRHSGRTKWNAACGKGALIIQTFTN
jgi:hypothetical protein